MTARTYLSIGDVLTLLREEFPDVTISKIRFLESQGLVNPERSPSGYRKFFETDVERLRWVLRQQREHFLPLKVIRDRLADGDLGEDEAAPSETATRGNGRAAEPVHAAAGASARGGSGSGSSSAAGRGPSGATGTVTAPLPSHEQSSEQSEADDQAMARILADANRRSTRVPEGADPLHSLHAIPDPAAPAPPAHTIAAGEASAAGVDTSPSAEVASAAAQSSAPPVSTTPAAAPAPAPAPAAAAPSTPTARAPRHAPAAATVAPPVSVPYPAPPGPGPGAGQEAAGHEAAAHEQAAPVLEVDAPAGARGGAAAVSGTGRGSGPRAAAERQGATAARAAESGAAAPREKGAGGASGKSAGGSAKSAGVAAQAAAQASAAGVGGAAGAAGAVEPSGAGAGATGGGAGAAGGASGVVTGASLTAEELCAASGLSEAELANLQGFGLIEPLMVAGIPTFDEDALTVANLAAAFRKFGIEARHLRPYRNAVDREVGLIEQVIIPLLRQRNPESRQRAAEAADELGALGQTMRATLMRAALRRHVGG